MCCLAIVYLAVKEWHVYSSIDSQVQIQTINLSCAALGELVSCSRLCWYYKRVNEGGQSKGMFYTIAVLSLAETPLES
jgi:hypothetical protein